MWKKLRRWLSRENPHRKTDLLVLLFAGVLLLSCQSLFRKEPAKTQGTTQASTPQTTAATSSGREEELEKRLTAILEQVEGAGTVRVMVTLENRESQVLAKDEKSGTSTTTETNTGGDRREISENTTESTVVQLGNGDGGTQAVVLTTEEAKASGVVIVAQGADNVLVRDALTRAAQALLGVPAHKVEVLKMK